MSVAFTGHRTIRTNKYALSVSLNEEVRFCYENGIRFFYIGCAVGFDMMAAHTVLEQRKQYPDMVFGGGCSLCRARCVFQQRGQTEVC